MFVVFEDKAKATGPKLHSTECGYYQRWLEKGSTTTTWHGPYKSKREAWNKCLQIAEKTGKKPSKHVCTK